MSGTNAYRKADPLKTKTGKDRLKVLSVKQLQERIRQNTRPTRSDKMRKELARRLKKGYITEADLVQTAETETTPNDES